MKLRPILASVLLLATAETSLARPHYTNVEAIDIKALLPGPSAPGSPETQAEIELMIERQKCRTPALEVLIKREGKLSPFLFDTVLGDWFTPENLPLTTGLLDDIGRDAMKLGESAKKLWDRPRPVLQDERITLAVGLPKNSSYPSSHAICGLVWGTILGELVPDMKSDLLRRGLMIGEHRMLAGVHFPSDLEAGRVLARAMLAQLATNERFQSDLQKARSEIQSVRPSAKIARTSPRLRAPKKVRFFFVDPQSLDLAAIQPALPAPGSPENTRDLEAVLQIQTTRTANDEARIASEWKLSPLFFAGVLGPQFTEENLPVTFELLKKVERDAVTAAETARKLWDRPRPFRQDDRVHPAPGLHLPSSSSRPSGHATCGFAWSLVLAELAPDLKAPLLARGREVGDDRVLGGVHFPTDVEAGRAIARALFEGMQASPAFQHDLQAARAELSKQRALRPAA